MNEYQENIALNVNSQLSNADILLNNQGKNEENSPQDSYFNIYAFGEVKYAQLHSSANRPLKSVTEDKQKMSSLNFCPC